MLQFFETLTDNSGNALLGATLTVTNFLTGLPAPIYATNATTQPIANSVVAVDITGQASFYVPDGSYTLTYSYQGTIYKTRSPVQMLDPMSFVRVADSSVSANTLVVSNAQLPAQKVDGMKIEVQAALTNTTAVVLVYQGDAGFQVVLPGGSAVAAGMIQAKGIIRLEWDQTNGYWQLIGLQGQPFYQQTAVETASFAAFLRGSVVNAGFPPLTVDRYGNNTTPGTTVMTNAWQVAINVGRQNGGVVTWYAGPYLIDSQLDLTNPVGSQYCSFALIGQGRFKAATNTVGQPATPSIILKHGTPGIAFDTTGSLGVHFENMSIGSDNTQYPNYCFCLARNSDGSSRTDRFVNVYVIGPFHNTILYNYAAENGMYSGCQFYNLAADSGTSVFDITQTNIRSVTSSFTTIASGTQSCLDHKIFGGEYGNLYTGSGTTADCFRFEGARQVKIYGIWIDCAAKSGASGGRSLFFVDGTNAPTQGLFLHGIDGEASPVFPTNGILVTNNAQTHVNWIIEGCWLPTATSMIGGGTGATIQTMNWINSTPASAGAGIVFSGAFKSCSFDASSGTPTAASFDVFTNAVYGGMLVQKNGQAAYFSRDFSQASGSQIKTIRNVNGTLCVSVCDDNGNVTTNNMQWLTNGSTQLLGRLLPVQDTGATQTTAGLYAGSGVPNNANGANGDFYLRGDTPGTAGARLYIKSAGAWVATAV